MTLDITELGTFNFLSSGRIMIHFLSGKKNNDAMKTYRLFSEKGERQHLCYGFMREREKNIKQREKKGESRLFFTPHQKTNHGCFFLLCIISGTSL
jgi:hypothetical protein